MRRLAVVIAFERFEHRRIGPNHGDRLALHYEWQGPIRILQQHNRFPRHLASQGTMSLRIYFAERNAGIGYILWRIEDSQAEALREQPLPRSVDLALAHQLVFE